MNQQSLRVLVVEDRAEDAELMLNELRRAGISFRADQVATLPDFLKALDAAPDIVLCDYTLPEWDGLQALSILKQRNVRVPFILVSGSIGEEFAVNALQQGVDDYLLKDRLGRLGAAVTAAIETHRLRRLAEENAVALRRSHAMLAVLNATNAAIVRMNNAGDLLEAACRIAVDSGGFKLAWICAADHQQRDIRSIAQAGDAVLMDLICRSPESAAIWKPENWHRLSHGESVVIDVADPASGYPHGEEALARGIRSIAFVPLGEDGNNLRAISLYSSEADFFAPEQIRLFETLADDLIFALRSYGKSDRLDYLALHDELTALPNRTLLLAHLAQSLARVSRMQTRCVLVLLDIAQFHQVNESFGHAVGDVVLKQIAERLKTAVRSSDVVARVGPNTFAMLAADVDHRYDIGRLPRGELVTVLEKPVDIPGGELRLAVRAGIAVFPGDGLEAESLLRNAEAALKTAKQTGDRYVFYATDINARVSERLAQETRVRRAVEKQEFVLHYQPKYRLSDGAMCGVEALIRWNDPASGLVTPSHFIAFLEDSGLILDVGTWALRQAMTDQREWARISATPPRVAVNVSALQLRDRQFPSLVAEAARQAQCPLDALELEITESVLMKDISQTLDVLTALRRMGVKISMDDFGTGYSSLSYLSTLPLDSVKIDRAFVTDIATRPQSHALVASMISMLRALGMRVVAEGVERSDQAEALRALQCDEVQGYLYCKPAPAAAIAGMFN